MRNYKLHRLFPRGHPNYSERKNNFGRANYNNKSICKFSSAKWGCYSAPRDECALLAECQTMTWGKSTNGGNGPPKSKFWLEIPSDSDYSNGQFRPEVLVKIIADPIWPQSPIWMKLMLRENLIYSMTVYLMGEMVQSPRSYHSDSKNLAGKDWRIFTDFRE